MIKSPNPTVMSPVNTGQLNTDPTMDLTNKQATVYDKTVSAVTVSRSHEPGTLASSQTKSECKSLSARRVARPIETEVPSLAFGRRQGDSASGVVECKSPLENEGLINDKLIFMADCVASHYRNIKLSIQYFTMQIANDDNSGVKMFILGSRDNQKHSVKITPKIQSLVEDFEKEYNRQSECKHQRSSAKPYQQVKMAECEWVRVRLVSSDHKDSTDRNIDTTNNEQADIGRVLSPTNADSALQKTPTEKSSDRKESLSEKEDNEETESATSSRRSSFHSDDAQSSHASSEAGGHRYQVLSVIQSSHASSEAELSPENDHSRVSVEGTKAGVSDSETEIEVLDTLKREGHSSQENIENVAQVTSLPPQEKVSIDFTEERVESSHEDSPNPIGSDTTQVVASPTNLQVLSNNSDEEVYSTPVKIQIPAEKSSDRKESLSEEEVNEEIESATSSRRSSVHGDDAQSSHASSEAELSPENDHSRVSVEGTQASVSDSETEIEVLDTLKREGHSSQEDIESVGQVTSPPLQEAVSIDFTEERAESSHEDSPKSIQSKLIVPGGSDVSDPEVQDENIYENVNLFSSLDTTGARSSQTIDNTTEDHDAKERAQSIDHTSNPIGSNTTQVFASDTTLQVPSTNLDEEVYLTPVTIQTSAVVPDEPPSVVSVLHPTGFTENLNSQTVDEMRLNGQNAGKQDVYDSEKEFEKYDFEVYESEEDFEEYDQQVIKKAVPEQKVIELDIEKQIIIALGKTQNPGKQVYEQFNEPLGYVTELGRIADLIDQKEMQRSPSAPIISDESKKQLGKLANRFQKVMGEFHLSKLKARNIQNLPDALKSMKEQIDQLKCICEVAKKLRIMEAGIQKKLPKWIVPDTLATNLNKLYIACRSPDKFGQLLELSKLSKEAQTLKDEAGKLLTHTTLLTDKTLNARSKPLDELNETLDRELTSVSDKAREQVNQLFAQIDKFCMLIRDIKTKHAQPQGHYATGKDIKPVELSSEEHDQFMQQMTELQNAYTPAWKKLSALERQYGKNLLRIENSEEESTVAPAAPDAQSLTLINEIKKHYSGGRSFSIFFQKKDLPETDPLKNQVAGEFYCDCIQAYLNTQPGDQRVGEKDALISKITHLEESQDQPQHDTIVRAILVHVLNPNPNPGQEKVFADDEEALYADVDESSMTKTPPNGGAISVAADKDIEDIHQTVTKEDLSQDIPNIVITDDCDTRVKSATEEVHPLESERMADDSAETKIVLPEQDSQAQLESEDTQNLEPEPYFSDRLKDIMPADEIEALNKFVEMKLMSAGTNPNQVEQLLKDIKKLIEYWLDLVGYNHARCPEQFVPFEIMKKSFESHFTDLVSNKKTIDDVNGELYKDYNKTREELSSQQQSQGQQDVGDGLAEIKKESENEDY